MAKLSAQTRRKNQKIKIKARGCARSAIMYVIKQGQLSDILAIETNIPEFGTPKTLEIIKQKLTDKPYLLLVAYHNEQPVGYKLGYALSDAVFYSWLGAVMPEHRGYGLAQRMLNEQEAWLKAQNYQAVQVKTMNRFRAMLAMLVKNHYHIIDIEPGDTSLDNKIRFEKVF